MIDCSIHPVHPLLKRFLSAYCIMRSDEGGSFNTLFTATTDAGLMFPFGEQKATLNYDFIKNPKKDYSFNTQQILLCGMHNEPIKGQFDTSFNVLCAICTPIGVHHLLRENTTAVLNAGFSFETLGLDKKFDGLIEKLQKLHTNKDVITLIESYLLHYYNQIDIPFSIKDMSPIADYICRRKGVVRINQIEDKFRISRRWIEKQFAVQIGLSPKEFARIIRFKSLLSDVVATPSVFLPTLMSNYNYYDPSHLSKDFKDFTGQTPTKYFQNSMSDINNFFYNGLE
jgi:AraC-like DNA-binding protein